MTALPAQTNVSHTDRFGMMLFFAIAVHMTVILGLTFNPFAHRKPDEAFPTMDVTLVNPGDQQEKPEKAAYAAQISQRGGGNTDKRVRATRTPKTLNIPGQPGINETTSLPHPAAGRHHKELLTQDRSPQQLDVAKQDREPTEPHKVSAAQLIMSGKKIASLSTEIDATLQAQADNPRERFISASTRQINYAAYMDAWRSKVERIGNLNYPEKAKRHKLSGSLILDVALRPNGTIKTINVRRSSGHKLLDDAAVRIVKLAAPFAPFPKKMRQNTDILHIIKTWQFLSGNQQQNQLRM